MAQSEGVVFAPMEAGSTERLAGKCRSAFIEKRGLKMSRRATAAA